MIQASAPAPRQFLGVMVSSTFHDFKQHRAALISAISGQGLHPVVMEDDSALPTGSVIDSSLQKVREAAAYIGIIGARYGNVPDSPEQNPDGYSLTELEFREARALGRPNQYAWADGEPYVLRHLLNEATAMLTQLGVTPPVLPAYDPSRYPVSDWEDDLAAAIREHEK